MFRKNLKQKKHIKMNSLLELYIYIYIYPIIKIPYQQTEKRLVLFFVKFNLATILHYDLSLDGFFDSAGS
jgi:hypothetical protein